MFKRIYDEIAEETSENIRRNEVQALAHSVDLLRKAQVSGLETKDAVEAIFFVGRLWAVFLEDLVSEGNLLPKELKAKIISIGIWALKYVEALRQRQKKDFQPLIDVSQTILNGLRTTQ